VPIEADQFEQLLDVLHVIGSLDGANDGGNVAQEQAWE
jgi:hypothetical protein